MKKILVVSQRCIISTDLISFASNIGIDIYSSEYIPEKKDANYDAIIFTEHYYQDKFLGSILELAEDSFLFLISKNEFSLNYFTKVIRICQDIYFEDSISKQTILRVSRWLFQESPLEETRNNNHFKNRFSYYEGIRLDNISHKIILGPDEAYKLTETEFLFVQYTLMRQTGDSSAEILKSRYEAIKRKDNISSRIKRKTIGQLVFRKTGPELYTAQNTREIKAPETLTSINQDNS